MTRSIKNSVEVARSPSVKKESRTKDFPNDDSRDLTHLPTVKTSRDDVDIATDQHGKAICSIERRDSGSSGDYEKMNVIGCKVFERSPSSSEAGIPKKTATEHVTHGNEEGVPAAWNVRSLSVNNVATEEAAYEYAKYSKQDTESSDGSDVLSRQKKKKKHRRFAKNVLHYMPQHLVKQPTKKKKKLTKKYALSSSLSSLRSLYATPSKTVQDSCNSSNLSREVTISPPSNFVHVASATSPSLVADENTVKSVVITHQQICATLPLLIGKDEQRAVVGNENVERAKVAARMSPVDDINRPIDESVVGKLSRNVRRFLRRVQSCCSRTFHLARIWLNMRNCVCRLVRSQGE